MAEGAEFLTVREVMDLLRLGRTTVYTQARLFLATGGAEGIPCRKFGRSLRFPAVEIRRYAGLPTGTPAPPASPRPTSTTAPQERRPAPTRPTGRSRATATSQSRRTASTSTSDTIAQPALPFTD